MIADERNHTMSNPQQQLFDKWMAAFNGQDADGIVSLFAKDGYLEDLALNKVARADGDLKEFILFNFVAFPNWKFVADRWDATDRTLVIEWTMTCPKLGAIPGMSSEGKPLKMRGVSAIALESGKIKAQRDYWDMADVLRQTGDLPSA